VRGRQVALLYLALGVLGAHYWLVERSAPEAPARAARPRFVGIDAAALREVRIMRAGRTIVARRAREGWDVVEPAGAAIPAGLIAAFANALLAAEEITRVADAAVDREAFGLDERAVRVELVPEAGPVVAVALGEINPTGTAVYAQRVGAPGVILIGRQARYYEDMIFQALPAGHVPAGGGAPIGG